MRKLMKNHKILVASHEEVYKRVMDNTIRAWNGTITCDEVKSVESLLKAAQTNVYPIMFVKQNLPLRDSQSYQDYDTLYDAISNIKNSGLNEDSKVFLFGISGGYTQEDLNELGIKNILIGPESLNKSRLSILIAENLPTLSPSNEHIEHILALGDECEKYSKILSSGKLKGKEAEKLLREAEQARERLDRANQSIRDRL